MPLFFNQYELKSLKSSPQLLADLLTFLSANEDSIEKALDYPKLASVNAYLLLSDLGFIFRDHQAIDSQARDDVQGWIYCGSLNVLRDVEVIQAFASPKTDPQEVSRQRYQSAKSGKIEIEKIYITKEYNDFTRKWSEMRFNPFMPSPIQQSMERIAMQVLTNLSIFLKSALEQFLKEFFQRYTETNASLTFSSIGVFNAFNHNRIGHKTEVHRLKQEIRRYLRIDEKWE